MILSVDEVNEEHVSHIIINEKLQNVMNKFSILPERVKKVITDGGSNIKQAVSISTLHNKGAWCLCHLLDLAVTDSFDNSPTLVKDLKLKVMEIVSLYHRSVVAWKNLKEIQRVDNELNGFSDCIYKLVNMVRTRWNTVHDMFVRILLLYDNVNASLICLEKEEIQLVDDEVDLLTAVTSMLVPISQLTKLLEADKTPTSHLALPMSKEAVNCLEEWAPMQGRRLQLQSGEMIETYHSFPLNVGVYDAVENFRKLLLKNVRSRLQPVFEEEIYRIASFLSPKFKRMVYLLEEERNVVRNRVLRLMRMSPGANTVIAFVNNNVNTVTNSQSSSSSSVGLTDRYGDSIDTFRTATVANNDLVSTELERYVSNNLQLTEEYLRNPISFWLDQRTNFPYLFNLAMEYLHVPTSSATSERVFSAMEQTDTPIRNRLQPETLNTLIFLKDHKNDW